MTSLLSAFVCLRCGTSLAGEHPRRLRCRSCALHYAVAWPGSPVRAARPFRPGSRRLFRSGSRGGSHRRRGTSLRRGESPAGGQSSLGGADAPQLRHRRARLSPVRGPPRANRHHGGSGGDRAGGSCAICGCRRRSPSPAPPVVPGVVSGPAARGAPDRHAPARLVPCPSRAARVNPPEVRPAHKSACLAVRRGPCSSLTIAPRAKIVGRIRPHGAVGGRLRARTVDNPPCSSGPRAACCSSGPRAACRGPRRAR